MLIIVVLVRSENTLIMYTLFKTLNRLRYASLATLSITVRIRIRIIFIKKNIRYLYSTLWNIPTCNIVGFGIFSRC
jgi:hypothetical protein